MGEPRLVVLDIETLPNLLQALRVWPQLSNYPGLTLRASINSILCIGWKVFGEDETHCISAWDFPSWETDVNDDKPLLTEFLDVISSAEGIITQNGKRFDEKFIRTRLEVHGLPQFHKLKHCDTKREASRNLLMFSNSLKHLAEQLTPGNLKEENEGWNLWVRAWHRDPQALEEMKRYCMKDVEATEALYRRLRKFSKDIPNHNLFNVGQGKKQVCPNCGSTLTRSDGWRHTQTKSYRRYNCGNCHTPFRTDVKDKNPRVL